MPTKITPLPDKCLIFVRLSGQITPDDLTDWDLEAKLPNSDLSNLNVLIDLSPCTGTEMAFEDMNSIYGRLERHYEPRNQTLRLIIFAPSDVTFSMSRMLQSLAGSSAHIDVQVFRNEALLTEVLPEFEASFEEVRSLTLAR